MQIKRKSAILLILLSTVLPSVGQTVESVYINNGDTVNYSYTPVAPTPQQQVIGQDSVTPRRKRLFFGRIIDYFSQSTKDRSFEKKIDFTFAGGPSYSKNTSLGIGILAAGLYRLDRTDSVTPPSNVSIFASISVSGFYSLGVEGHNIFRRNKNRIDYTAAFTSAPRDLWGIGYNSGRYNQESSYVEKHYKLNMRYLHQFLPKTFIGAIIDFEHTTGKKFKTASSGYQDIAHQRHKYTMSGVGALLEYDSRDFIPNPYRGIYLSWEEMLFPKGLGNCSSSIWRTRLTADFYKEVWSSGVLAADLYAEFNSEGTPWPMLARMGGSQRMRGYYEGKYTDNDMITIQIELRQRIWRRIGCVVWAGAGNVFPSLEKFNWSHTLPNYGVGLRWELKKRINVRLDTGFGRKTSGFLLNINEAF